MRWQGLVMTLALVVLAGAACAQETGTKDAPTGIYAFKVKSIDGQEVPLAPYKGKVLLIVNVASRCGYTPQYRGLESLYTRYKDKGLVVLGFPSNDFGRQEPGTNAEIKAFCRNTYGVDFPMFEKIAVTGAEKDPLYKYLTEKETNPEFAGEVAWNFNKFLVDRKGKVVARFASQDYPEAENVVKAIEDALAQQP